MVRRFFNEDGSVAMEECQLVMRDFRCRASWYCQKN